MSDRDPFTTGRRPRASHDPPMPPRKPKAPKDAAAEAEAAYQRVVEQIRLNVWGRP